MKTRVISGIAFGAFTLAMLLTCIETRMIFFLICGACCCWEMRKALSHDGTNIPAWFVFSVFGVCSVLILTGRVGYAYPAFMVLMVAVFAQLILVGNITVKDLLASFGMICYPLSFILICMYINSVQQLWAAVLFTAMVPALVSDTFALFGGKRFGKHKLAPTISPKKTVEGLICGLIAGTVSGIPLHFILDAFGKSVIPLWAEVIAALMAALAGALGDLAASAVKREAGIKDYSNLIPGHGGMLDRVDSSIFAMPVVYMIYALFV